MLNRRTFLHQGSLFMAGAAAAGLTRPAFSEVEPSPLVHIGLLTDLHYADKETAGTRHYRDTLAKISVAAEQFQRDTPDFVVELGDFIDAADSVQVEMSYLRRIEQAYAALSSDRHYVLGNHCVDMLTSEEFLDEVQRSDSYYSFDHGGYHFVIVDSCYRSDFVPYGRKNAHWTDPNIPPAQLEWLQEDLSRTGRKTIVFAHQRLDVADRYSVRNAGVVRQILEQAGTVLAVFQGHSHKNDYQQIEGIHYCTLAAMVEGPGTENNAFAYLDILPGDVLKLSGFHDQQSRTWD